MDINPLLVEPFIRDAKRSIITLNELLASPDFGSGSDLSTYIIAVHGMKSSLLSIGEADLSGVAASLEKLGRSNDYESIAGGTPLFLEDLRLLLEKIQPGHEGVAEGDDPKDLHDRLHELIEKCVDYNRKGALEIIAGIKSCSVKTKAVLEVLKDHVLNGDYHIAEATAARYADKISSGSI